MKKKLLIFLLSLLLACSPALAEYWENGHEITSCPENHAGSQVIQMVMMGAFDQFDLADSLSCRVFSAAFPRLCAVTEEELEHFAEHFGVGEDTLEQNYFIALANCLWADILMDGSVGGEETYVRRVLHLFLDPAAEENAAEQMESIRARMTEEILAEMAELSNLPVDFVEHLIYSENWREFPDGEEAEMENDGPDDDSDDDPEDDDESEDDSDDDSDDDDSDDD